MCHVCYYNNSDATFRLLISGNINPNPEPVSASTAGIKDQLPRDECQKLKRRLAAVFLDVGWKF